MSGGYGARQECLANACRSGTQSPDGQGSEPRMLTRSEIDLLRQSAREIAEASRAARDRRKASRDPPAQPCAKPPSR